jgi:alkylation response protein AidB-like acyl-CoA dehydrogenase
MRRHFYDEDHEAFRDTVRAWVEREVVPHLQSWENAGHIDPALWVAAGRQGLLGLDFPEEYGGGGAADFRYRCVVMDELARVGAASVDSATRLVDDLVGPYLVDLATEEQRSRWLPGLAAGTTTGALAITEPGAGSDLRRISTTAVRDGDGWRLAGSKTFITNGGLADVLVVVARTEPAGGFDGFSLFVVESGFPGFSTGKGLDKLGQRAENVAELFFDGVPVPAENLLGRPGRGLAYLKERLPRERLSIGYYGLAASEAALEWTLAHVRDREIYDGRLADLQNVRLELASMATEIDVTRSFVNEAVLALNAGDLSATDAAKAKWWATDLQTRVTDRCLQLFGGYGYIREYPIARAFVDARIQTIYGGANEVMRDLIGRRLVQAGTG